MNGTIQHLYYLNRFDFKETARVKVYKGSQVINRNWKTTATAKDLKSTL